MAMRSSGPSGSSRSAVLLYSGQVREPHHHPASLVSGQSLAPVCRPPRAGQSRSRFSHVQSQCHERRQRGQLEGRAEERGGRPTARRAFYCSLGDDVHRACPAFHNGSAFQIVIALTISVCCNPTRLGALVSVITSPRGQAGRVDAATQASRRYRRRIPSAGSSRRA
jgi:hypothetical protein